MILPCKDSRDEASVGEFSDLTAVALSEESFDQLRILVSLFTQIIRLFVFLVASFMRRRILSRLVAVV